MAIENGIISPDDHVVEPPDLWKNRLANCHRDSGPRVVRRRIRYEGDFSFQLDDDDGEWADVWLYENLKVPTILSSACPGWDRRQMVNEWTEPILYENMRPGCFKPKDRLLDMDANGVEASMCFPNVFVRFSGQRFLEAPDKELALLCVRAYNDWIVEEWCVDSDHRLIPLCIVPLWDAGTSGSRGPT